MTRAALHHLTRFLHLLVLPFCGITMLLPTVATASYEPDRESYVPRSAADTSTIAAISTLRAVRDCSNTIDQPLRFPGQYFDSESGLHYNLNRYYDPDTGRYISLDQSREGNGYSYALNNPLVGIDPLADVTIIVHGTVLPALGEGRPTWQYDPFVRAAAGNLFGDYNIQAFDWCGGNTTLARQVAGHDLLNFLRALEADGKLKVGKETINIIAHSHGGNVVKWFSQMNKEYFINNVVTLGTPQNGTMWDRNVVGNVTNVYSEDDAIQAMGGNSHKNTRLPFSGKFIGEAGIAGRVDTQAERNVIVNFPGIIPNIENHSRLRSAQTINQISFRQ